ncbi:sialoadhesin-like [Onychostoma macrolepis]|uniref:sialoadhesin-like n=1 Tax=Onychostoma macrolepis TaxID=369639 RepID=UPI00272AFB55|nr:sialoadhesin-like [Onychostoma macrolepis]
MGSSALPLMLLLMSFIHAGLTQERPKPVVDVDPDRRVFRGETVTLTCDIQQTGDWQYSWYKDGNRVNSARQEQNYIISSVDWSHGGVYSCIGSQSEAPRHSQYSDGVRLTVSDLPRSTLTVTPDSPVFTGERVNMTCVIEFHSYWRYEWYKGNIENPMSQTSDHYTVNESTLSIVKAVASDQGWYWCRGQRDERPKSSHFSSAVSFSVEDLPRSTLTVTPDSPVFTGETVNLKCVIESDHRDWRYEWFKDSVMLQPSDRYTVNRDTLTIRGATESDQGQYWCRGHIDRRSVSSQSSSTVSFTVTERPKPVVKVTPDQRVFSGETVTLTCDIQPAGHIWWTYSWFKDGDTRSPYTTTTTAEFRFTAYVSDSGEYSCRGERSDSQRSDISAAVTLTVSDSPTSTLTVTPDRPVFTGETVTLTCVIESHSDWRYEWNKDSIKLQTSDGYTVNRDTLTIRGATESDQGQYWCRGQRDERPQSSQSSSAVSLSVEERPKPVLKVIPDQRVFRGETVTLTCDIQPAGTDTQWTYSWFKDGSVIKDVTERVYSITSVSDSVTYSCRGERSDSQRSDISAAVTLTVSED